MERLVRCFVVACVLVLLGNRPCAADQPVPALIRDPVYLRAHQLVAVEHGRRLNLYCSGKGSPTVIFDSGMADPTNVWGFVQPAVASKTRACSYDRAGVGFSDPGRRPSTAANIVDDLHRLLQAALIKPPYIIVAHSSAGNNVRLYTATYPSEIVGMVLVDPSSEDQTESFRKLDPRQLTPEQWETQVVGASWELRRQCISAAEASHLIAGTELYKKCSFGQEKQLSPEIQAATIKFQMTAAAQRAQLSEEENFGASQDELRAANRDLGDMPLIVLTEGSRPTAEKPLPPDKQALRQARDKLWFDLNARIATWSKRGEQRVVPGAGHAIHLEKPQVVSDAILEVWRIAGKRH